MYVMSRLHVRINVRRCSYELVYDRVISVEAWIFGYQEVAKNTKFI